MYAINPNDDIIKNLEYSTRLTYINSHRYLEKCQDREPVIFRGMAKRKTVNICKEQGRDFYYIDTGYLGNIQTTKKDFHRIVKNNVQHMHVNYNMPSIRFDKLVERYRYLEFKNWKKNGKAILVVVPSEKPCKFYGVDKTLWLEQTLSLLKKYTDRPIIVREKQSRNVRADNHLYKQLVTDDIFAVVTYNSIAAVEAIGFGIPAFTAADTAANDFCSKDLSKIEEPYYADTEKIKKWQHWLAYCQYTVIELQTGRAMRIIEDYNLQ